MDAPTVATGVATAWALRKVLGPTLDELGERFRETVADHLDKVSAAARRKVPNLDDGKRSNIRVTRDVLWNGAAAGDEICAEYFGGILAASRSQDGKDDSLMPFVDVVKAMSSEQLRLHYSIYHSLGKVLNESSDHKTAYELVLPGKPKQVTLFYYTPTVSVDLPVLQRHDLISRYAFDTVNWDFPEGKRAVPYVSSTPSIFGIMLYAAVHNRLEWWQAFGLQQYADFPDIKTPKFYAPDIRSLYKVMTHQEGTGVVPENRTGF